MKLLPLLALGLAAVAAGARADMYQDASNAVLPVARTNLGLGTMATQNATAVAITGGTVNGTTIGATTPSTAKFTSAFAGTDQYAGTLGTALLGAGGVATAFSGALTGELTVNLPPSTPVFPVATSGLTKLAVGSNGNQAFGLYGLAELFATGGGTAIGGEVTVRNASGNNPNTVLPPNQSFGTTDSNTKAWQIGCGAKPGNKDCTIGNHIGNETGNAADPVFNTAEYIQLYRQYGLYIDAMPSGTQTSAVIKTNGNGASLLLQDTAVGNGNALLQLTNANGPVASITNQGHLFMSQLITTTHTAPPTITACGTGPVLGTNASDTSGYVQAGTGTTTCTITFGRAHLVTPACVVAGLNLAGFGLTGGTTTAFTVAASTLAGAAFTYICLPQGG